MREQGRQLLQADQDHKGHRVVLGCHGRQLVARPSHHPAVGQQRMRSDQHLLAAMCQLRDASACLVTFTASAHLGKAMAIGEARGKQRSQC